MAFSEVYDITFPPDTQAIGQGALDIRNFKQDIAQRIANLSGITVASAEALGYETNFYGAPFIDSSTGKVYNIGGTFTEITSLILANISEPNTTLQAAIVAAIAAIPATSPGPLVLPALTNIQSPQITGGPGTNIPTTATPPAWANTQQIANCAWVLQSLVPTVSNAGGVLTIKFPLSFSASPGGAVLTYISIVGGISTPPSSPATINFPVSFLSTPMFVAGAYGGGGSTGTALVESVTSASFTGRFDNGASGFIWIAIGTSN